MVPYFHTVQILCSRFWKTAYASKNWYTTGAGSSVCIVNRIRARQWWNHNRGKTVFQCVRTGSAIAVSSVLYRGKVASLPDHRTFTLPYASMACSLSKHWGFTFYFQTVSQTKWPRTIPPSYKRSKTRARHVLMFRLFAVAAESSPLMQKLVLWDFRTPKAHTHTLKIVTTQTPTRHDAWNVPSTALQLFSVYIANLIFHSDTS
jgi:hypothetical protein